MPVLSAFVTLKNVICDSLACREIAESRLRLSSIFASFLIFQAHCESQEQMGGALNNHIRERRIVATLDAMERDGLTIAQAAHLVGYKSATNFSTAFKKILGYSPSEHETST